MSYDPARALELLRLGSGNPAATFRDGQEEAIQHVVEGRGRLLVVQKTGWGKSFVYFIAIKLLREQGAGPALLISPLLALMRNQIAAAERMGLRALTINSDNRNQWPEVEAALLRNEVDILLVSPERLANERFVTQILAQIANRISLLIVDEAHCISDWGHDFRPHYRLIERFARALPQNARLLATTATANNRVVTDLQSTLGPDLTIFRGDLARPSLFLQTIQLPSQAERLAWLAEQIPRIDGSGIVYALTKRDAELVAEWLQLRGISARAYHADLGADRAQELEDALLANQLKVLVATTKLGMGYDKPDLAFVIHFQSPASVVAYYQQVGRAGRALAWAYGTLLSGTEETEISNFFIESAFPSREEAEKVLAALQAAPDGLTVNELLPLVNATRGRIEKALQLMSLESPAPVLKQGSTWTLTPTPLSLSFWERAARLTQLRREEQEQMRQYLRLPYGHMDFLIRALDGIPGTFNPPDLPLLPTTPSQDTIREAIAFLRRTSLPVDQRKKWPDGGLPVLNVRGNIPLNRQAQPGKALSVWGDAGWASLVRQGKYRDGRFSDELIAACVALIRDWAPQPAPTWVACVPSRRHPTLVPEFARRLAAALGLPFHTVLEKTDDRPEQKLMANSALQARNLDGSLAIINPPIPNGAVLLVDDMRDSGWTFTVAAYLLLSNGSGPVFPLALALTSHADEL